MGEHLTEVKRCLTGHGAMTRGQQKIWRSM